jgi:hypothetical protein
VHAALLPVLVDQLHRLPGAPLRLPWPTEPRAVAVAVPIAADVACDLTDASRAAGAGRRTLGRIFVAQTGRTPGG